MSEPVSERSRRLVIGVGNRFRHDDGIGPWVADALRLRAPDDVQCLVHEKDGADLVERWKHAESVFVVDATRSGRKAGVITRFEAHEHPLPVSFFRYSSHAFALAEAVELGRVLGALPPRLVVFGVEGARWDAGEGLTPGVAEAGRKLLRTLETALGPAPVAGGVEGG